MLSILITLILMVGVLIPEEAFLWVLLASPFLIGLIYAFVPDRAARRRSRGLCVSCGYDLRGGQSRCPECGSTQ